MASVANRARISQHGIRILDVRRIKQINSFACGLAVTEMLLAAYAPHVAPVVEQGQLDLLERLDNRRGREPSDAPQLPLRLRHISWLLWPLACEWRDHPTVPRIKFSRLKKEIDEGRPFIMHWLEDEQADFLESRAASELQLSSRQQRGYLADLDRSASYGHVTLCIGYVTSDIGPALVMYDPSDDGTWGKNSPDRGFSWDQLLNCVQGTGQHLVAYDGIARNDIDTSAADEPRRMRWVGTGMMSPQLHA